MKFKQPLLIISMLLFITSLSCQKDSSTTETQTGTGKGGSLARFTIVDDYLYTVDEETLKTFNLADPRKPELKSAVNIGREIETIYAYGGNLYIGSTQAMYIYSLQQPATPEFKGEARHLRACDPVVAQGNYAYVTVRSGAACGGNTNALLVYDVSDSSKPLEISRLALKNPHGLGIKNKILYICDGNNGLVLVDIQQPKSPSILRLEKGYNFKDCLIHENTLIAMVAEGMAIYDISIATNPQFIMLAK